MRITGRQLRRIIQEEVARMVNEEGTGGLAAAADIEAAPYKMDIPGTDQTIQGSVFGTYSQAGDRLVRDAVTVMNGIRSTAPGGDAATGAFQSNLNDVILNRARGQNLRATIKNVLGRDLDTSSKFVSVVYALAKGATPPDVSNSSNSTTAMNALMKMVSGLGYPVGVEFNKSFEALEKISRRSGRFMEDLNQVVSTTPPSNLRPKPE